MLKFIHILSPHIYYIVTEKKQFSKKSRSSSVVILEMCLTAELRCPQLMHHTALKLALLKIITVNNNNSISWYLYSADARNYQDILILGRKQLHTQKRPSAAFRYVAVDRHTLPVIFSWPSRSSAPSRPRHREPSTQWPAHNTLRVKKSMEPLTKFVLYLYQIPTIFEILSAGHTLQEIHNKVELSN